MWMPSSLILLAAFVFTAAPLAAALKTPALENATALNNAAVDPLLFLDDIAPASLSSDDSHGCDEHSGDDDALSGAVDRLPAETLLHRYRVLHCRFPNASALHSSRKSLVANIQKEASEVDAMISAVAAVALAAKYSLGRALRTHQLLALAAMVAPHSEMSRPRGEL